MPNNELVAERLKAIRSKLGLTQSQFANLVGVKTSTIAMYETGERIPRDEVKQKIAQVAGTTVDPIFLS